MKNRIQSVKDEPLKDPVLGASDIVNGAGGQFEIKETEMESALREIMAEIDEMPRKNTLK